MNDLVSDSFQVRNDFLFYSKDMQQEIITKGAKDFDDMCARFNSR